MKSSPAFNLFRIGVLLIFAELSWGSRGMADSTVTIVNGKTDLTAAATYNPAVVPTSGSNDDIVFTGTYSPSAFTLSGTTTAYYGTLNDNSATSLTISNGTASTTSVISLGGTGFSNGYAPNASDLLYVASTGTLTIQNGTGTLNISLASSGNVDVAGTATINSVVNDGGYGITKTGTGILSLGGANMISGATTVSAGTLEFTKEVSLYNDQATVPWSTSNIIVQSGGTLAVEVGNTGGFTATDIGNLLALATSSGGFESGSNIGIDTTGASFTYSSVLSNLNSGSNVLGLAKLGTNTLTLTGVNTYTGSTTISAGTLTIGGSGQLGGGNYSNTIYDTGTLAYSSTANQTLSGSIIGTGALAVGGTGTLTLSNVNFFSGGTSVTAGTLDLSNSFALEDSVLTTGVAGNLVFDSSVSSNAFTLGGLSGSVNLSLQNNSGSGIALTVGSVGNPGSVASANNIYSGVLSGSGSLSTFGLNNTLTLEGANTYTGATTIGGGTLNLGGSTANGSINSSSALILNNGILAYTRTGTVSQSFNGTTIAAGQNSITESTSSQTINLGAITNNLAGTVDFSNIGTITTTNGNTNGILGGYATYGGKTTWATVTGGTITGLAAGSYTESGSAGTSPLAYLDGNIDVNASETPTGPLTVNTLRFNTATAYTLTLSGLNTITSGGILVTPTATAGETITGGTLTGSASGQLDVINGVSTGTTGATLIIGSQIVDNGGPTAVVTSGVASRYSGVNLSNANNSFSGGLFIDGGSAAFASGGTAFGVGNVTFGNNGEVYTNAGGGAVTFGNGTTLTSGLLVDALGANASNGDISDGGGTGTWTLIGNGSASFNGIIGNYSPGRVLNLVLDSGTQIIGNTQLGSNNLTVNGGTLQLGTGYWGSFSQLDNNMKLTLGGGTFEEYGNIAGYTSQGFATGLAVNSGASTILVTNNGAAGTVVSFTGAITRSVGGTVNFTLPTGAQTATNGVTTVTLNTNGILGGYATVGGTDWATNATNTAGGNIIGLSASSINSYTSDAWAAGNNTTVTTNDSVSGATTNSLRFNSAAANTVTLAGNNIITSGGILITPNVGGNLSTITGGTLEGAASADLVVIQNNTSSGLTIGSVIANNGGATALTKSGAGLLTLTNTNTYTGALYLNGGTLNATAGAINSSSTTNGIFFNGGALQAAGAITTGKAVSIGVNGGTIDLNGNSVALSGAVTSSAAGNNVGAGLLGGFDYTGEGQFSINNTSSSAATISLSAATNAFYGGLSINGNSTVQDGNAAAGNLGSGNLIFGTTNSPTVDLNGNNATVAALVGTGTNGTVTNSSTGTSTLTLDGTASNTFNGAITNGNGTVALTLNLNDPAAVQTLGGTNTYTGATTVTSGTLLVGNGTSGSISSSSPITITGGSLLFNNPSTTNVTVGSVSLGVGALGFASSSVAGSKTSFGALSLVTGTTSSLNFGSATSGNTLSFSSILATSTTSTVLDIFNYGTSSLNTLLSATTLNATTLGDIVFYSGSDLNSTNLGTGAEVAFGGGGFQIVPGAAPEPSTYIAAVFLLGLVGMRYMNERKLSFS